MINYRSSCKVKLIKWQNPARNLVNNLWYYSPIWFKFWVNNSIHKNCETIKKFTRLSRKIKWSNMRFWSAVLSTTWRPVIRSSPLLLSILSHYSLYKCSSPHKDLHLYFEANNHSKDAMGKHHTTNCYPFHEFPW